MSLFITLEGPDGSGKTTQAYLLAEYLRQEGYRVTLTREPGGSPIGDQIRTVLHDRSNTDMDPHTEFLLYSASRAQLVSQVIRPMLAEGKIVISDRFYDSSLAYQGYGRGLNLDIINRINRFATDEHKPDITFLFDIDLLEMKKRKEKINAKLDRMEDQATEFFTKVREGYLQIARQEKERFLIIDCKKEINSIVKEIWDNINIHLSRRNQNENQ